MDPLLDLSADRSSGDEVAHRFQVCTTDTVTGAAGLVAMIISHEHQFIFLHCRKAAGSSVAVSLSRYLGKNDIQLSAIEDGAARGADPPRRMVTEALLHPSGRALVRMLAGRRRFWQFVSASVKARYAKRLGSSPEHAPASRIAHAFPEEWGEYYKFCVVRNPWDKTVSDYHWRVQKYEAPPSFAEYVRALGTGDGLGGIVPIRHSNWELYTIGDVIQADFVVRFENLVEELAEVCSNLSVPWDGWLPQAKSRALSRRQREQRAYRAYYTDDDAAVLARLYAKEIRAFEYTF